MHIVSVEEIPSEVIDVPKDNLFAVFKICQEMEAVCVEETGIGLSAVQVGIPWNLFVVKRDDGFEYYVDCKYEPIHQDKALSIEGCLSLKNNGKLRHFRVDRYPSVRVSGKKLVVSEDKPKLVDVDFAASDDIYCVVFQHEIDHQLGILISDIGEEIELEQL